MKKTRSSSGHDLIHQMRRVGLHCTRCITRSTRRLTNAERLNLWRERLRAHASKETV